MKRTILLAIPGVLLLAALILGGTALDTAQAHPSTFPDVAETHPAHVAIETLAERDIIAGTLPGDFLPNDPITRAQAAKILVGWQEVAVASGVQHLSDVPEPSVPYVGAALAMGWMSGFPDGTFRPADPLSRQQMAVIVVRAMELQETALALPTSQVDATLDRFWDEGAISPAARPFLAVAVMKGLLAGDQSGRLNPTAAITRAQFSLVVHRADVIAQGGTLPSPSEHPVTETAAGAPEDETADTDADAGSSGEQALTEAEQAQAAFMDTYLFRPRNSPVTGEMVVQNARWYGIPVLSQLVIMAAETSLGDPVLGGSLARHYNFGCLRYHGADTAWGQLSSDRIWVAGKDWYAFPSAQVGMSAFGRYLKTGCDGFYAPILSATNPDWNRFAGVYYGRSVSGFSGYVGRLNTFEDRFRSMAADHGVTL